MAQKQFWDFDDNEDTVTRLIRTTVACSLGFKPPAPFGNCDYCPARRVCDAVRAGLVAAAKHNLHRR